jgi:hypothetical protein
MRIKHICLLTLFAAISAGCNTEDSGGPGASTAKDQKNVIPPENTFKVDVPNFSQTLKQGEAKSFEVKINRQKNFDQDVTISFNELPNGVTVLPARFVISAGDEAGKATINAAPDAALGDFEAKVVGTPAQGANAESDLKIKIEK